MRVLVTGGYGFIGSFVVEKFYQEGHDVVIIDNLSSGKRDNVTFKHKSFIVNIEADECEQIFKAHQFDVVVHLAAQTDVGQSLENPVVDSKSNVYGLTNMLYLANKYGVEKFVFASTAAVYGNSKNVPIKEAEVCKPISPYGTNKLIGEYYCKKWKQVYDLDIVRFRFSNVYGPRQVSTGEGGVISIFIEKMLKGEELSVFGDGSQTRDFIYVGDVSEAIYRAVMSGVTGVFNLSTNTETNVNDLIGILKKMGNVKNVTNQNWRTGDIHRSKLDNSKIKKELDWIPKYSIEEGIKKTYSWFAEKNTAKKEVVRKEVTKNVDYFKRMKPLLPYIENVFIFLVVLFISFTSNIFLINIDIKLLYIIFIGLLFGKTQAVLAIALAVGLYTYENILNGRDWLSLFIDNVAITHIAVYIFVGLLVGYIIDKKNIRKETLEAELVSLQKKYHFLDEIYQETRSIKEDLHNQIVHSEDGIGKIHNIISKLDSLEPEDVFNGAISVLEQTMRTNAVAIYIIGQNDHFLRLISKSNNAELNLPTSLRVNQIKELEALLESKTIFINRKLEPDLPFMMAPIVKDDQTIAVVCLYHTSFENVTLYYQNLFHVVINLLSTSVTRAFEFVNATHHERYLKNTSILKPEYFHKIVNSKKLAQAQLNIPYTLLEIQPISKTKETILKLASLLRNTDNIGVDPNRRLWIILSNTNEQDATKVIERLNAHKILVKTVKEEKAYA